MNTIKVKPVNAFTYRPGFGRMTVVDTTPDEPRPTYKPLYYATRQFGIGEDVEAYMDNGFPVHYVPDPVVKKTRKKRR